MDRDSETVAAANEALSRKVNEGIERGRWPGERDQRVAYRCECTRSDCSLLIELTPREYEAIRSRPRRFLVTPGHERSDMETVIERQPDYLVVEKRGQAGAVAQTTDPRP